MTVADAIRDKLTAALAPCDIVVNDQSALHAGHAGARPGGETHFAVRVVSHAFEGLSRLERQRRIHEVLAKELKFQIHALSLTTLTPSEANK